MASRYCDSDHWVPFSVISSPTWWFLERRMFDRDRTRGLFRPFIGAAGLHVIAWPCGRADAQNIMCPWPGCGWECMRRTWPVSYATIQRVCVWVIKESDCHIRRPTREGCGLCPSLFLCTPTPFLSLLALLASPGPRHSAVSNASRTRFRDLFLLRYLSFFHFLSLSLSFSVLDSTNSLAPSLLQNSTENRLVSLI